MKLHNQTVKNPIPIQMCVSTGVLTCDMFSSNQICIECKPTSKLRISTTPDFNEYIDFVKDFISAKSIYIEIDGKLTVVPIKSSAYLVLVRRELSKLIEYISASDGMSQLLFNYPELTVVEKWSISNNIEVKYALEVREGYVLLTDTELYRLNTVTMYHDKVRFCDFTSFTVRRLQCKLPHNELVSLLLNEESKNTEVGVTIHMHDNSFVCGHGSISVFRELITEHLSNLEGWKLCDSYVSYELSTDWYINSLFELENSNLTKLDVAKITDWRLCDVEKVSGSELITRVLNGTYPKFKLISDRYYIELIFTPPSDLESRINLHFTRILKCLNLSHLVSSNETSSAVEPEPENVVVSGTEPPLNKLTKFESVLRDLWVESKISYMTTTKYTDFTNVRTKVLTKLDEMCIDLSYTNEAYNDDGFRGTYTDMLVHDLNRMRFALATSSNLEVFTLYNVEFLLEVLIGDMKPKIKMFLMRESILIQSLLSTCHVYDKETLKCDDIIATQFNVISTLLEVLHLADSDDFIEALTNKSVRILNRKDFNLNWVETFNTTTLSKCVGILKEEVSTISFFLTTEYFQPENVLPKVKELMCGLLQAVLIVVTTPELYVIPDIYLSTIVFLSMLHTELTQSVLNKPKLAKICVELDSNLTKLMVGERDV